MGIFKAYDIRGIVPDELDETGALAIGRALGVFLSAEDARSKGSIAVGHDMRGSSPGLARAVARGLTETGRDVVAIGLVEAGQEPAARLRRREAHVVAQALFRELPVDPGAQHVRFAAAARIAEYGDLVEVDAERRAQGAGESG